MPAKSEDELDQEFERATGRKPRKNLSFGDEGESLLDVLDRSDIKAHESGLHEGEHFGGCPLCEQGDA